MAKVASNILNFTISNIEAIPTPDKRVYYKDTKVSYLSLMVTPTGSKSFKVRKRYNGKFINVTLGKYPELKIDQARNKAHEVITKIINGDNPNDDKKKVRQEITFGEMHHEYLENYCKIHRKYIQNEERDIPNHCKHLFSRRASSITTKELQSLHTKICTNNGGYQANRITDAVRAMYNKHIAWGWEGKNPALHLTRFKEKSRDRFLLPQEMPRFMKSLAQEENHTARDFVYMCLFTGARRTNVLMMKWKELDFISSTWRIPETKNGDSQLVVLSPPALKLLNYRKEFATNEWVFEGDSKKGYFSDPKRAWKRILDRAEIEDLRIHDLRRTLGSWQAAMGANSFIIGKSLGHKSQTATAIYARLNLDPVRDSVTKATEAMLLTME